MQNKYTQQMKLTDINQIKLISPISVYKSQHPKSIYHTHVFKTLTQDLQAEYQLNNNNTTQPALAIKKFINFLNQFLFLLNRSAQ